MSSELVVPNPLYGEFGRVITNTTAENPSQTNSSTFASHVPKAQNDTISSRMDVETTPIFHSQQTHGLRDNAEPMQALYATVNEVPQEPVNVSMANGTENNEYNVTERCQVQFSSSPKPPPVTIGSVYSQAGPEPLEDGEVYNVAYPVLTPNTGTRDTVDGYECLSSIR